MNIEELINELHKLPKDLKVYTCSDYFGTDVISIGIKIRKTITNWKDNDEEGLALFVEPLVSYGNLKRKKINIKDPYNMDPFPRKVWDEWM